MRRTWKQIGSLFLAFCMVFTMLPTMAFAETGDVDSGAPLGMSGTITAFAELGTDVANQTVEAGTTEDALNLPDTLTVTVTTGPAVATATDSDAQQLETRETETAVAVSGWTSDPAYDGDTVGDYVFTPTLDLPEGLMLAGGATLPTVTVTVREKSAAPQARGMVGALGVGTITGTMSVGGTTVSDLTQDDNGTGWTWEAESATLTLGSSYPGDFIKFECDGADTINLVCNGTVTVNKGDTYAIQSWGSLVIKGDGPLTISDGGITASKDIVILGAMGNISGASVGISAGGSVTISGTVGDITSTAYTIYANGDITISDGGVVGKIGAGGTGSKSGTHGIYAGGSVTINGVTGDISGKSYGIYAKGGNVFINGATGAISSAYGSLSGDSAICASVGVAINGTTGAISSKGDYGIYAESGAVLIAGKTGDITGTKARGILAVVGGITIPPGAVVGKIAGAQSGIEAGGSVTIGGKTGDITGIAGSTFGGGIQTTGSITITGETGAITSTHASIPAIGAGGDVTIVGSVGEIAVITSSSGGGFGILALGGIHIINSVTVSSFNGAFNKAPATLPPSSYTATWSDNPNGSASSTSSTYVWNASHKYVKIEKDSGMSAPTVSGFRAERTDADKVSFFFTPSTTGKYGCQIEKKGTPAPTFLGMFHDITAIVEICIDAKEDGVTASDILVVYLQIENAEGVKSQIYSLEVPAYTPAVDAAAPNITGQPIGAIYDKNAPAAALSVAASVTDGGTLSYQWYYNLSNNTTSGGMIGGAIGSSYTPDVSSVGTVYYYCVVTNTNSSATGNKTAAATSNTVAITVNAPGGATTISEVAVIDVGEPVGGEQNDIRANVPNDAKYGLGGKDWFDVATGNYLTEGEKFVAGKQYLYEVRVILDAGYTLAPGFTATINGKAATVYDTSPSGSESNIYCAFTAKDASGGMLDAQTPNITGQPVGATYTQNAVAVPLSVAASVTDGGTLSYQWHGNSNPEKGGIIPGATGKTYTPSTSAVGTMYYWCIVTNTNTAVGGNKTATIYSNQISVTVQKGGSSDNGNGGNSGGGGYTPPATMPTTPQAKPNQPVTAEAPVAATAGANGTASASIPEKSITDAIAKAQADAKAQGKTANGTSVALNVTMPQGATSLTTTLTQSSLNSLVNAGVTSFEINGAPVSLGLDLNTLKEIQKQSGGNITISIAPATGLSGEAKTLLGNRPVYNITISYVKDGKPVNITSLGSGTSTLSIPYTPGKNEAVGYLFGVYVDANGKPIRIDGSAYDANSGSLLIPTGHFSVYGVGYTAPSVKFTDISTHWGKEAIDYVVGRGLLSGTSETTFAPDTAMTRGMLVTALGRLANVDTKAYTTNSFTDVKADSAFRPYIEWAYKKGIIQGIGNQQFVPDRAITREEIAVIFASFAKATGYTLPVTREATSYADVSSIGSVYKTAVTAMQQAGIMMGGSGNRFNPKASATRAEVSSMLHRYIRLTIDPATAQGWAKKDAGQYLYYKDGKALTGTQTIDGVTYFLGTDGTLKTGWVKDGGNWRYYSGNKAAVGWLDISNKRYYFTKDGNMISGKWLQIDGKWYYFNADGTLARSTKINGYEVDKNGVRKMK